jgi:hypothetical protein
MEWNGIEYLGKLRRTGDLRAFIHQKELKDIFVV